MIWTAIWCACTSASKDLTGNDADVDGSETSAQTHSGESESSDTGIEHSFSPGSEVPCDTGELAPDPLTPSITWWDSEPQDGAGEDLWVGDLDGDGVDEVLVGASSGIQYTPTPQSAAYLMVGAPPSGSLEDASRTLISGWGSYDDFGTVVVGIPTAGLVGVGLSPASAAEVGMYFYDPRERLQQSSDSVGGIVTPDLFGYSDAADCYGLAGRSLLCLSTVYPQFSGTIWIYEGPFNRTITQGDEAIIIEGAPGDEAVKLLSGADLDGDALTDLVVGAITAVGGAGRIAVVSDPSPGVLPLWDVAHATINGRVPYGELGMGLDVADVDGDGHPDLFGGAMGGGGGEAYVFLGPFTGDLSASDAAITVVGDSCHIWTGYSGALPDLDGDGNADLAVAQPQQVDGGPGRVVTFLNPNPGVHTAADADFQVSSVGPSSGPDWIGYRMLAGNVDGDGYGDLLISAPFDDKGAPSAGAVHVVLGSRLDAL